MFDTAVCSLRTLFYDCASLLTLSQSQRSKGSKISLARFFKLSKSSGLLQEWDRKRETDRLQKYYDPVFFSYISYKVPGTTFYNLCTVT